MTGYARTRSVTETYAADVELRSLNHRYQDIRVKLPPSLASYEKAIRDRIAAKVARGQVEAVVRLQPRGESAYQVEVDRPLLEEIMTSAGKLASELGLDGTLTIQDLISLGVAFNVREKDLAGRAQAWEALEPALDKALEEHQRMRTHEGNELARDLEARVSRLGSLIDDIERRSGESREQRRQDLAAKIEEVIGAAVEPSAVVMEIARLVERADISEEITRFRSHLTLWAATIVTGSPCGKKLDFIVQEMSREANTMGAKCQDAVVSGCVIAVKAELERIREQVQNIE